MSTPKLHAIITVSNTAVMIAISRISSHMLNTYYMQEIVLSVLKVLIHENDYSIPFFK